MIKIYTISLASFELRRTIQARNLVHRTKFAA